jgi:[FeFe] hydrogenase H-cluster maturation GTPase HydF
MSDTPKGERINISFIGRTNVGKSTIINNLISQDISIVSDVAGTTTDPVAKRFELHPIGPITIFDTAGYDDVSELGKKRVNATQKIIFRSDLTIVVVDNLGMQAVDIFYVEFLRKKNIPFFVAWNKSDISQMDEQTISYCKQNNIPLFLTEKIIDEIIQYFEKKQKCDNFIIRDFINIKDIIILVMPIDSAAPKGRIILPQTMVLREILDASAIAMCCQVDELASIWQTIGKKPRLVVTDSQVVDRVCAIVPQDVLLTTFSILFARYKGELSAYLSGVNALYGIKNDDLILISEACSHHSTHDDIGTIKIPNIIRKHLNVSPVFIKVAGHDFPDDLEKYKLVIQCGGCMMSRTEIVRRIRECELRGVPITNFGMVISKLTSELDRVTKVFETSVDT